MGSYLLSLLATESKHEDGEVGPLLLSIVKAQQPVAKDFHRTFLAGRESDSDVVEALSVVCFDPRARGARATSIQLDPNWWTAAQS